MMDLPERDQNRFGRREALQPAVGGQQQARQPQPPFQHETPQDWWLKMGGQQPQTTPRGTPAPAGPQNPIIPWANLPVDQRYQQGQTTLRGQPQPTTTYGGQMLGGSQLLNRQNPTYGGGGQPGGGQAPPGGGQAYDPRGTFGTKPWTQWNYTTQGVDPAKMQEEWFRNSQWAPHQIWSEPYGFQDIKDIEKLYAGGQGLEGLTPQMEQSFAGSKPKGWQPNQPRGGQQGGVGQGMGGYGVGGGSIYDSWPYPNEWNTASNVLSNFAMGAPTAIPQSWDEMLGHAQGWAEGGKPGSSSEWLQAQQPIMNRQIEDQAYQMAEQMGMGGLRWSSPLQGATTEAVGRANENLYGQAMGLQMGLDESAKARAMGALGPMFQYGQGVAGLAESAKNRGMGAAQGLMGLGQQKANLPMQVAQGMGQAGYGQTALGQSDIDRQIAEFMRMSPENSQWLQYAMQMMPGMQQPYATPQYQPSPWTQGLNAFAGALPWWMMNQNQNQPIMDFAGGPSIAGAPIT